MEFSGLQTEHFAAYSQEKWSSNVHNLARMRAKSVMMNLAEAIAQSLGEQLKQLERGSSSEVPTMQNHKKVDAQWIFWFRNKEARDSLNSFLETTPLDVTKIFNLSPQEKNLVLAVILREQAIWVGLSLGPSAIVDRKNFATKLEKTWELERFLDLVKNLPDTFSLGAPQNLLATPQLSLDTMHEQMDTLQGESLTWQIGRSFSKEEMLEKGGSMVSDINLALTLLLPLYRFVEWHRDNDHIEVGKKIQEEKEQKRRAAAGYGVGDKVRMISGLFAGKIGVVTETTTKGQVKVQVGKMSVVANGTDVVAAQPK